MDITACGTISPSSCVVQFLQVAAWYNYFTHILCRARVGQEVSSHPSVCRSSSVLYLNGACPWAALHCEKGRAAAFSTSPAETAGGSSGSEVCVVLKFGSMSSSGSHCIRWRHYGLQLSWHGLSLFCCQNLHLSLIPFSQYRMNWQRQCNLFS